MATKEYTVSFNSDTSDSELEMTETDEDTDDDADDVDKQPRAAAVKDWGSDGADSDDADDEFIVHRGAPPPYVEGSYNRYTGLHDIIELDEEDAQDEVCGNDEETHIDNLTTQESTTPEAEFTFTFSSETSGATDEPVPHPEPEEDVEFTFSIDFSTEVIEHDPSESILQTPDADKDSFDGLHTTSRGSDSGVVSLNDENDTATSVIHLDDTIEESEKENIYTLQTGPMQNRELMDESEKGIILTDQELTVGVAVIGNAEAIKNDQSEQVINSTKQLPGLAGASADTALSMEQTGSVYQATGEPASNIESKHALYSEAGSANMAEDIETLSVGNMEAQSGADTTCSAVTEAALLEHVTAQLAQDAVKASLENNNCLQADSHTNAIAASASATGVSRTMGAGEDTKSPEPEDTVIESSPAPDDTLAVVDHSYCKDESVTVPHEVEAININEKDRDTVSTVTHSTRKTVFDDDDDFDPAAVLERIKAITAESVDTIEQKPQPKSEDTTSKAPQQPQPQKTQVSKSKNQPGFSLDTPFVLSNEEEDESFEQRISRAKAFIASVDQRMSRSDSTTTNEAPKTPDASAPLMEEDEDVFNREETMSNRYNQSSDMHRNESDSLGYDSTVQSLATTREDMANATPGQQTDDNLFGMANDAKEYDYLVKMDKKGQFHELDSKSDYSDDYVIGTVMVKTKPGKDDVNETDQNRSLIARPERQVEPKPRRVAKYVDRTTELIKRILAEERGEEYVPPELDEGNEEDYEYDEGEPDEEMALVPRDDYNLDDDDDYVFDRKINAMREKNAKLREGYSYADLYDDAYDDGAMALVKSEQAMAAPKPRKVRQTDDDDEVFSTSSNKISEIMQRYKEDAYKPRKQRPALTYPTAETALALRDTNRSVVPSQRHPRDELRSLVLRPREHTDPRALVPHSRDNLGDAREQGQIELWNSYQSMLPYKQQHYHDNEGSDLEESECTCKSRKTKHVESLPDDAFLPQRSEDTEHVVRGRTAEIKTVIDKQQNILQEFRKASESFDDINQEIKAIRQHMYESAERRKLLQEEIQFDLDQAEEAKNNKDFLRKYLPPPEIDYTKGYVPGGLYNKDLYACKSCDKEPEPIAPEKPEPISTYRKPLALTSTSWRSVGARPSSATGLRYQMKPSTFDAEEYEDKSSVSSGKSGARKKDKFSSYSFKQDDIDTGSDIALGESASVRSAEDYADLRELEDNGRVGDATGLTGIQAWRAKFSSDITGSPRSSAKYRRNQWRTSEDTEVTDSLTNGDNLSRPRRGYSDGLASGDADDAETGWHSNIRPYVPYSSGNDVTTSKYSSYPSYNINDYGAEIESSYVSGRNSRPERFSRSQSESETQRLSTSRSFDTSSNKPFKSRFLNKVRSRKYDEEVNDVKSDPPENRDKPFKSRFLSSSFSYASSADSQSADAEKSTTDGATSAEKE